METVKELIEKNKQLKREIIEKYLCDNISEEEFIVAMNRWKTIQRELTKLYAVVTK